MQRVLSGWVAVAVALLATGSQACADDAFVHLQTDRASYRLGETVWFRVHRLAPRPTEVVLFGPRGQEVARKEYPVGDEDGHGASRNRRRQAEGSSQTACTGSFLIPLELGGGAWHLAAYVDSSLGHSIDLNVYDLEVPLFQLDLTVLGRVHFPGQPVLAAFRALDRDSKPMRQARVEYRADFGDLVIREAAGVTDDDGRAVIRFTLPKDVRDDGNLSVGLAIQGRECAVARPVFVSSSVGSVEAYPEGGAVVEGMTNRVVLRTLDVHGRPAAAAGRIVDQDGKLAATFESSPQGLVAVLVPYDAGRTYQAVIDKPAGVTEAFPLPSPSPDALSIYADVKTDKSRLLQVEVRGGPEAPEAPLVVSLQHAGRQLGKGTMTLKQAGKSGVRTAQRSFKLPSEAGLLEVVVESPGARRLVRPVFIAGPPAVNVQVKSVSPGPLLPGKAVELELLATIGGAPAAVDLAFAVHQGETTPVQDLPLRSALSSYLPHTGCRLDESLASPATLDAFLLAAAALESRRSTAAPGAEPLADEMPLLESPRVPHARRVADPLSPRPAGGQRASDRQGPATVVRSTALEKKLWQAPFTRSALPPAAEHSFRARVAPEHVVATPGLGKEAKAPPQEVALPARVFDGRRTLLWASRVQTGKDGKARLRLRLNHVVADLTWAAQGFAEGIPISTQGRFVPTAEFETKVDVPPVVHVGDVLDLLLRIKSRGDGGPIAVNVEHSRGLKPLLRTRFTYDPKKDSDLHRLIFEVTEPSDAAELRIVSARGLYEEIHARKLGVTRPGAELVQGTSGYDRGTKTMAFTVPANALPGSVHLEASVAPSWLGESEVEVAGFMIEPTGCFEQTSSKNFINLLALRTLLEMGHDPRALERGYRLASEGFAGITRFMDPATGGFCPWGGKGPDVRASVTGLRQLALHAQVFQGEGERELAAAVHWLEGQRLSSLDLLYLTSSLHEAGKTWSRSAEAVLVKPESVYEEALQAAAMASWPSSKPAPDSLKLPERLARLLDRLETGLGAGAAPGDWGVGIMGSSGQMLALEVLALAAGALFDGGRLEAATRAVEALAQSLEIPRATQGKLLALRTLARINGPQLSGRLDVELTASPGGTSRVTRVFQGGPPILFDWPTELRPGAKAGLTLDVRSDRPLLYRLGCRYQVNRPISNANAAFEMTCSAPLAVDLGKDVEVKLAILPRQRTTSSQVVARIALPAGLVVAPEQLAELMEIRGISLAQLAGGYLDLYWGRPIAEPEHLTIKAKAAVAGNFAARPSTIYPYYESGREAYAEPLAIKVHNTFGIDTPIPGRPAGAR